MHAFTPITHTFLHYSWFSVFLFVFYSFFFVFFLFSSPLFPPFYCARLWPFILPAVTSFAIFTSSLLLACCGCLSRTAHQSAGCPTTTTTLCWSCHASFSDKSGFVLFFTPLDTHIRIRLDFSFTNLYRMHLVILTHVYLFWVKCHPSRTFPPKELEREP